MIESRSKHVSLQDISTEMFDELLTLRSVDNCDFNYCCDILEAANPAALLAIEADDAAAAIGDVDPAGDPDAGAIVPFVGKAKAKGGKGKAKASGSGGANPQHEQPEQHLQGWTRSAASGPRRACWLCPSAFFTQGGCFKLEGAS